MGKIMFLFVLVFVVPLSIAAQSVSQSIISPSGGYDKTPFVSLEWTLGDLAVETSQASKHIYTQGFHQPLVFVSRVDNALENGLDMEALAISIAPNPVNATLTVSLGAHLSPDNLSFNLTAPNGKALDIRISRGKAGLLELDMAGLSSGLYMLHVQDMLTKTTRTFKVIKIQ
jgi:hypothetical protein